MNNNELLELINSSPLNSDIKNKLANELASGSSIDEIADKYKSALDEEFIKLSIENPEAKKVVDEAEAEYVDEVGKATAEFEAEMNNVEKEADTVGAELSNQIDQIRQDELRDNIQTGN